MYSVRNAVVSGLAVLGGATLTDAQNQNALCIGESTFMCAGSPGSIISYTLNVQPGNSICTLNRNYCPDAPATIPLTMIFGQQPSIINLAMGETYSFNSSTGMQPLVIYNGEPQDNKCQTTVALTCDEPVVYNLPQPPHYDTFTSILDGTPKLLSYNLTNSEVACELSRTPCLGHQTDPILFGIQSAFYTPAQGALAQGDVLEVHEGMVTSFKLADNMPNALNTAFFTAATSDIPSSRKNCSSAVLMTCTSSPI